MKHKMLFLLLLFSTTNTVIAHAAGDAKAGATKAAVCTACHNSNSNNTLWPKLEGQHSGYLMKQLRDFKSGARKDPNMTAMVAPLSAQDIEDLAAHFSAQQRSPGKKSDAKKSTTGEQLFFSGNLDKGIVSCVGCHASKAEGNPAGDFPALHGQHKDYLIKTLQDFRSGTRLNDPALMMHDIVTKLDNQEIEAVAEYLSGL